MKDATLRIPSPAPSTRALRGVSGRLATSPSLPTLSSLQRRSSDSAAPADSSLLALAKNATPAAAMQTYTFSEARAHLRPGAMGRILERFEEHVEQAHGVAGLAERLLEMMEFVVVPPGTRIFDQCASTAGESEDRARQRGAAVLCRLWSGRSLHLPRSSEAADTRAPRKASAFASAK